MLKCGLLGEKLGHSYSPAIHAMLADYEYILYEKSPDELEKFIKGGDWDGLNVTIPYKKAVLPFCSRLSDTAKRTGSVNTLVKRGGEIFGDNTDAYGFSRLIELSGVKISGKEAVVFGSGGVSATVCDVLAQLGAESVSVVSRTGRYNYENLSLHRGAEIIVNATPVGMYPGNGKAAADISVFPKCEAVFDMIYNPARTALLLQAERLGIAYAGGLYMLVSQAKRSCEIFTGTSIPDSETDRIEKALRNSMQNIVIIGMPGSGKSTISSLLGEKLGRTVYECDNEVEKAAGQSIQEIFGLSGEGRFRMLETEALRGLGKLSGAVISTGGGCVTRDENYPLLHQNGRIVWLRRDISLLEKEGRPISISTDLYELYRARKPRYAAFADMEVENDSTIEAAVNKIMEILG